MDYGVSLWSRPGVPTGEPSGLQITRALSSCDNHHPNGPFEAKCWGCVSLVTEVPFTVVWVAHGWQRIEAYDSVTL
jgi:hypothetical protein